MLRFALAFVMVLAAICAHSQTAPQAAPPQYAIAAPKVLLLVYQQFLPGKAGTRQNLQVDVARNFDRLAVPISWIELESLTGPSQALFIDPAASFADIEKAGSAMAQIYGTRADVAQSQQQIDDLIASSRTLTAILRDDLSINAGALNLAKAHYLRVRVVQVSPQRERDFLNAVAVNRPNLSAAKSEAVYEVNAGMPDLTFLFIAPMRSMQDVDQEKSTLWLAPLAFSVSSETNLFAIHPEMSHVGKDFAAAEPSFWIQTPAQ